jgi:serine/threonine-protein kinase RsbW
MARRRSADTPIDGAGGGPVSGGPGGASGVSFERSYPAVPESVAAVRAAVVRFARSRRLAPETVDAVKLAVSEAATNVIVHAYPTERRGGRLDVTAALAGDELWVIVADSGSGLQPSRESPGLGLGLAIIARVADGVDLVSSAGGGLEVRMRFAAPGAGGS